MYYQYNIFLLFDNNNRFKIVFTTSIAWLNL